MAIRWTQRMDGYGNPQPTWNCSDKKGVIVLRRGTTYYAQRPGAEVSAHASLEEAQAAYKERHG